MSGYDWAVEPQTLVMTLGDPREAAFYTSRFPSRNLLQVYDSKSGLKSKLYRVTYVDRVAGKLWVEPYRGRAPRALWRDEWTRRCQAALREEARLGIVDDAARFDVATNNVTRDL